MAYQHFYSRVPAKMSLYNRLDGYDTFAKSDALPRETIEKEISLVYDNAPEKDELPLIRGGKLPPVYSQFFGKNGEMIQSCISYIPSDYTGERSSYMVHSLVLSEDEKNFMLYTSGVSALNPEMFLTSPDIFALSSADSKPIDDYPEIMYVPTEVLDPSELLKLYDPVVLRTFVYMLLTAACVKNKKVFFSMPVELGALSREALSLLTSILEIFPYHLRTNLSFITYTGDCGKYGNFKVKCLPNAAVIPSGKGFYLDFGSKVAEGIKETERKEQEGTVSFLMSLFSNSELRKEFLCYMDNAVKSMPSLDPPTLKSLSELVFLFCQCCGYFHEEEILPNDDVLYSFICVYEKYRNVLSGEYRVRAMKTLQRYPGAHLAIPKNIFSKVTKCYRNEPIEVRRVIMSVVLQLIHTDIMRDKLFTFIRTNYDVEEQATRDNIVSDLCRVFYGGFLQAQILAFFAQIFPTEPETSGDLIVEKILLTIRTPSVQDKILEFFTLYYSKLTEKQKIMLITTVFEMIPECDRLSEKLIYLIDRTVANDTQDVRTYVVSQLLSMIEADQRKKERRLLAVCVSSEGFVFDTIISKIFLEWFNKRIFLDYADLLYVKNITELLDRLIKIWQTVPYMPAGGASRLLTTIGGRITENASAYGLKNLMEADEYLKKRAIGRINGAADKFFTLLRDEYLHIAAEQVLYDALQPMGDGDLLFQALEYANINTCLEQSAKLSTLRCIASMLNAAEQGDTHEVFRQCEKLPTGRIRTDISYCLARHANKIKANNASLESMAMLRALTEGIKSGFPSFTTAYSAYISDYNSLVTAKVNMQEASLAAMRSIIKIGAVLYISDLWKDAVVAEEGELCQVIRQFLTEYGKNKRTLLSETENSEFDAGYRSFMKEKIGVVSTGGIFRRLFGRKR